MPRLNLTQDEVDSFRQLAAATALEMIEEEGRERLTLRALAARLGCSYAKPYRYFRDKHQLIDAVRGCAFDLLGEFVGRELETDDAAASRPMAHAYLRFAFQHPEAFRIMFELRQGETSAETRDAQARAWKICAQPFHDAVAAGTLVGDPELIAHASWSALHGLASLALADQLHLGKTVDEIAIGLDALVDGFRPGASSRGRPEATRRAGVEKGVTPSR